MTKAEQPTITQSVDVFAERKAFEAWWARWVPDGAMPSVTSHIFDAWLASARHRTTSLAAQDGLVERVARALCELHIRDVRRHDTELPKLEAMLDGAVDYSWRDFEPQAKAALSAIKGDK